MSLTTIRDLEENMKPLVRTWRITVSVEMKIEFGRPFHGNGDVFTREDTETPL